MKHHSKICIAAFAACLILSGCGLLPEEEVFRSASEFTNYESDDYSYVAVAQGDLLTQITVTARLGSTEISDLSFPVSNIAYAGIYVEAGTSVVKGQLLAELDCEALNENITDYEQQKAKLNFQLEHYKAMLNYDIQKRQNLYDEDFETASQNVDSEYINLVKDVEGELYLIEVKLANARSQKADRQLYSPIDGTVTFLKEIKDTDTSVADVKIITVSDDSLIFSVETKDYAYFVIGEKVPIVINKIEYSAVVTDVSNTDTKYRYVYMQLLDTADSFAQGTRGTVTIVKEYHPNVLYLPRSVVTTIDGKSAVYVLDSDGVRRIKYITTGFETGNKVEIVEGLSLGDAVIKR